MNTSEWVDRSIVLLLLCIPILGIGQDGYPRNRGFDIKSYLFSLELNDQDDSIQALARVILNKEAGIGQITLDLVNTDASGRGMIVTNVRSTVEGLDYQHINNKLLIQYPSNTEAAMRDSLWISYKGIPRDGLIIAKNKHGDRTFFGDNWPNRAHHWLPVVDHPSEKAFVSFKVKYPNKYQCVSNGYLKEEIDVNDSLRLSHWVSTRELPVKVAVIGVAQFAVQISGEVNGHEVSSWVYPQEGEKGFYDYAICRDILEYYSNKIAPYPFEKLANVQSKTRYGGMENAGCIFYHENSINGKRGSESLFAHEIVHQWFGNSASEADWHHVWLSEGFATYLTEVYIHDAKGVDAFNKGMEKARKRIISFQKKYPNASTIDSSISDLNRLLSPMTYQRAAWFLHMLRARVGEDDFWAGMKLYYREYKFGNVYSDDFRKIMEKVSKKDLALFFDKWLYEAGMVKMDMKWSYNEDKQLLSIHLQQPRGAWFPWSSSVLIINSKGHSISSGILHVDQAKYHLEIPMEEKPKQLVFDPLHRVLKW